MTIFAVMSPPGNDVLENRLVSLFPNEVFVMDAGQYLVHTEAMTSMDFGKRVGATGDVGKFAAFAVTTYWGWHGNEVWEWLKIKAQG